MEKTLQKLIPKSLEQVLEAYVRTWSLAGTEEIVDTPLMTIFLGQGSILKGEVIHVVFEDGMLSMRLSVQTPHVDTVFVEFRQIQAFTLHEVDTCPVFLEELQKV